MAFLGTIADTTPHPLRYRHPSPVVPSSAGWNAQAIKTRLFYESKEITTASRADDATEWNPSARRPARGSRILPTWAIDVRGYFVNTQTTTSGTVQLQTSLPRLLYTFPTIGIPVTGSISGKTKEKDGTNPVVIAPYRQVILIYRPTGQVIMRTTSDAAGAYTFSGLEPTLSKYVVLGLDLDGTQYDAVAHDRISPV